jgi:hypothetical protein
MNKILKAIHLRASAARQSRLAPQTGEMMMFNKTTLRRAAMAGLAALTLGAAVFGSIEPASAHWYHPGWGWGGGWHHGWGYYHRGYWGGWYGGVCPPGFHLGYWGQRCWPNY